MPSHLSLLTAYAFLPRPRRPPRLIVQEQDHRPDLALREEILPLRHRRVPRRALARQPGAALGHAPKHEALGELRDGAVVLEVGRKRIEAGREVPLTVEDNGTIAQLTESFVFWRVAKGGPGLPREGTPWNSAMPKWEDFLTEREIWSVILFLYDQTGWTPRTWEKTGTGDAGRGTGHD